MPAGHQGPGVSRRKICTTGTMAVAGTPAGLFSSGKEHSGHGSSLGHSSGPPIELFRQSGSARSGWSMTASRAWGASSGSTASIASAVGLGVRVIMPSGQLVVDRLQRIGRL
ncbi:hypothetical protein GCM10010317_055380 [Streptomyces mirabilis]|nr:hypothetical protein GCM10010317_055380 [Streptomyces mirabilis]